MTTIDLDNYKNERLKPARNVRFTMPRCCLTCKHHTDYNGFAICHRVDGWEGDVIIHGNKKMEKFNKFADKSRETI